jgi:DNA-binding NarL/FixJ family response regulator
LSLALSSESDIDCVGTANGVVTAIDLTGALRPDVVVMDVRLGDGDGIAATAELKHRFPDVRVVILTAFPDTALVSRVLAAHASALLPKDGELGEMLEVIRDEASTEFYVHPRLHTGLVTEEVVAASAGHEQLPQQEQEILRMLVAGFDVGSIAREMGVPEEAARRSIKTLLAKIGAHSRFDALVIAMRNGLIRAEAVD